MIVFVISSVRFLKDGSSWSWRYFREKYGAFFFFFFFFFNSFHPDVKWLRQGLDMDQWRNRQKWSVGFYLYIYIYIYIYIYFIFFIFLFFFNSRCFSNFIGLGSQLVRSHSCIYKREMSMRKVCKEKRSVPLQQDRYSTQKISNYEYQKSFTLSFIWCVQSSDGKGL